MVRNNNFDLLRFSFAILVVISHSFPLSGSIETEQWINIITNRQLVLADIGLNGFFVISGFFIFRSFKYTETVRSFLKKRFLRLFPGLFVVLLLSLVLIPVVYDGVTPLYKNVSAYTYVPYNFSLYLFQGVVSGVFDTNPYHAINGSLWTIRYEFSLYMVIALLFFIKSKRQLIRVFIGLGMVVSLVLFNFYLPRFAGSSILGMQGFHILNLGSFFVVGSFLASFNFEKLNMPFIILIGLFICLIGIHYDVYRHVKHIALSILIMGIGFMPIPYLKDFGKLGDSSYGIYIYSFPVQQVLVYYFQLSTTSLIYWSVSISIVFGYLSWHFVEKQALKYKNRPLLVRVW